MSIHDAHHAALQGETLEEPRDAVLASAQPFPGTEEMLIEGLSDDEEACFLAAIADA